MTDAEFAATLARVLHRPAKLPTPTLPLKLRLRLASSCSISCSTVSACFPEKLLVSGFTFAHPDLETALRAVLEKMG